MGQATVDLPDPSEVPNAPAGSADDLLSQLAGDEIDRLLSEAEVEKGPPPAAEAAAPVESASMSDAATADEIDRLFAAEAEKAIASPAPAPKPAAAPVLPATPVAKSPNDDSATAAQIDALFNEAAAEAIKPADAPPVARSPSMPGAVIQPEAAASEEPVADPKADARQLDDTLAKASAEALPQVKAVESETSTAEKSALAQAIDSLEATPQPATVEQEAVPFYLKPLVWLNLPMELLPQAVREAVGKIALHDPGQFSGDPCICVFVPKTPLIARTCFVPHPPPRPLIISPSNCP